MNKVNKYRLYVLFFIIITALWYAELELIESDYYRHEKFKSTAIMCLICGGVTLLGSYFVKNEEEEND